MKTVSSVGISKSHTPIIEDTLFVSIIAQQSSFVKVFVRKILTEKLG